ncbi:MAG: hypothetical protein KDD41_07650 [Flavobacteriales bacterium]|nr:hypothetical protein [Flavobacteriales bacterium]
MSIYKFRVLLDVDSNDSIFRDVEIKSTQTFFDLHEIIVASFGFDNSQMASFYLSDEGWNRGQEIALFDMNLEGDDSRILVMEQTKINTQITCVGAHLLYSYDFLNMRNFFIELIESKVKEDETAFYPKVVYSQGEPPLAEADQSMMSEEEIADQLLRESGFEDDDDDLFNDDLFEDFDDFENFQ